MRHPYKVEKAGSNPTPPKKNNGETMNENCKLILGNCLEKLKELQDESIDLVLTDPPYGLEFMGKDWDKWQNSFNEQWASAVLPKMKNGAFLVFTMTPRQDLLWRCLAGLEKAGFNLRFSSCFWLYHTGFPKSADVSKTIDKKEGKKGKIINEKIYPDIRSNNYGNSQGKTILSGGDYLPETEQAKQWLGWKSCSLKPAVEMIIVAQKPRKEKTIVEQVLKNGCGAINIEECRIPYANKDDKTRGGFGNEKIGFEDQSKNLKGAEWIEGNPQGRFPANLIVQGEPLQGESKSGSMKCVAGGFGGSKICYGKNSSMPNNSYQASSGSPNRFYSLDAWATKRNITLTEDSAFFDVPKPATSEKEKGIDGLEKKDVRKEDNSANSLEIFSNQYTENSENPQERGKTPQLKNFHPTCKPVLLFSYLAKLFCQPNGTILDPFMGSGTTGISALQQGFKFIGIEKEEPYFLIAKKRISRWEKQTRLI